MLYHFNTQKRNKGGFILCHVTFLLEFAGLLINTTNVKVTMIQKRKVFESTATQVLVGGLEDKIEGFLQNVTTTDLKGTFPTITFRIQRDCYQKKEERPCQCARPEKITQTSSR